MSDLKFETSGFNMKKFELKLRGKKEGAALIKVRQ